MLAGGMDAGGRGGTALGQMWPQMQCTHVECSRWWVKKELRLLPGPSRPLQLTIVPLKHAPAPFAEILSLGTSVSHALHGHCPFCHPAGTAGAEKRTPIS